MRKLKIRSIPLPDIYICDNDEDADKAKHLGVPYIYWKYDIDHLIKIVMYPYLINMFPGMKWDEILGVIPSYRPELWIPNPRIVGNDPYLNGFDISDIPIIDMIDDKENDIDSIDIMDDSVTINNSLPEYHGYNFYNKDGNYITCDLMNAIGDLTNYVDINVLQKLNLLPTWLSDIKDSISHNLDNLYWYDGYNKKLGISSGNFESTKDLENLMILDISGSIPQGVSSTMISLIDTLRRQANANLIITGSTSKWYPIESELPDPETIRRTIGLGNEGKVFCDILHKYIYGKEFGNLICFGDNDAPLMYTSGSQTFNYHEFYKNASVKINKIWSYHTEYKETPGYALWAKQLCPSAEEEINTDWVKSMKVKIDE